MDVARVGQARTYRVDGVTANVLLAWGTFDSRNLLVTWMVISPDGRQPGHSHPGSEQVYIVVSGTARLQVREERELVSAGALVYVPPGAPHAVANAGAEELVVITAASPPFPVERYFAEPEGRQIRVRPVGELEGLRG